MGVLVPFRFPISGLLARSRPIGLRYGRFGSTPFAPASSTLDARRSTLDNSSFPLHAFSHRVHPACLAGFGLPRGRAPRRGDGDLPCRLGCGPDAGAADDARAPLALGDRGATPRGHRELLPYPVFLGRSRCAQRHPPVARIDPTPEHHPRSAGDALLGSSPWSLPDGRPVRAGLSSLVVAGDGATRADRGAGLRALWSHGVVRRTDGVELPVL